MRFRLIVLLATALLTVVPGCGSTDDSRVRKGANDAPPSVRCPTDWPGPWTACPEAAWVRLVAVRAGFRIVDETGSALVAQGRGRSFYLWATEIDRSVGRIADDGGWLLLGRRAGVRVYGDGALWRLWSAQGFVFWLQAGPLATSRLPDLDDLEPLVRASMELSPPRAL